MKVILHSDDAGSTASITERIVRAWQSGVLDSFSLITNGPGCGLVSDALRAEPSRAARLAVHLNLSEGSPAAPLSDVPMLVNGEGVLNHTFGSLLLLWLRSGGSARRALLRAIETEWRAQMHRASEICAPRAIDGVDSHNYVHMLPFLFPIALRLAEEAHIAEIRVCREPLFVSKRLADLDVRLLANTVKYVVLRCLALPANRLRQRSRLSSGAVVGVLYSGIMSEDAAAAGIRAAERSGADRVEVIFHIGRATANEAPRWDHMPGVVPFFLSPRRDGEYEALRKLRNADVV